MSDTPTVVALPRGASAVLWDAETIPNGRRRRLLEAVGDGSALRGEDGQGVPVGVAMEAVEAAMRCMVRSWTVRTPDGTDVVPVPWEQPDVLDDLVGGTAVLDALIRPVIDGIKDILPRFDVPKSEASSTTPATPA